MVRYLLGVIIGTLLVASFQYEARYNSVVKYEKHHLREIKKIFHTGCLTGYNRLTGDIGVPQEFANECEVEALNYREPLLRLYGYEEEEL
jgi:hypothetical protein